MSEVLVKVGEALLCAAVGVLVERLASKEFINFFRGRKHDERLLKKLEETMVELNKVLNDAENKQFTDQRVKRWLDEVKVAVYHVEDLVNEIATEDLRSKVEADYPRGKKRLQDNSLISTFARFSDRGGTKYSKLEEMIGELDQFVRKAKDVLGLREVAGRYWSQTRLPSTSVVDESCVYGREDDKEVIMKLLLCDGESSNRLDVIPIVGMPGVGKTTLAQLLYNDGRVDAHFAKKAWVCISDVFDVSRVTLAIIEAVTERACDIKDPNWLAFKLKESLRGKKFLIVLDDVWNENDYEWNVLMTPFKFGSHGSKIIVTTHNEKVATMIQTVPIHGLQTLLEPPTNLKLLEIKNYGGTKFPTWLGDQPFGNMEELRLEKCKNCFSLPPLGQMPSLRTLTINDCPEIESFPEGGLPSSLTDLSIKKCEKLKSLPEQMHTLLPSLKSLDLHDCPEIESFPEGGLPTALTRLDIRNCKKLVGGRRDWGLQTLPSLTEFSLYGESEDALESFPEEGLLPPTLTFLGFGEMPDLKSLNGRGLQPLVSLKYMEITDCPQLQSLSVERLPTSLSMLEIWECPLLVPRCRREEGEDWHKIAHKPRIYVYMSIRGKYNLFPLR